MFILLTGSAHEGKTTACWKAVSGIRTAGGKVARIVSPPLLSADGVKVGIEMLDLATSKRQILTRGRTGSAGDRRRLCHFRGCD